MCLDHFIVREKNAHWMNPMGHQKLTSDAYEKLSILSMCRIWNKVQVDFWFDLCKSHTKWGYHSSRDGE